MEDVGCASGVYAFTPFAVAGTAATETRDAPSRTRDVALQSLSAGDRRKFSLRVHLGVSMKVAPFGVSVEEA